MEQFSPTMLILNYYPFFRKSLILRSNNKHDRAGYPTVSGGHQGGAKGGASPLIIFTEALVLKSGIFLLSWLQQFVRLCVTLCSLVT